MIKLCATTENLSETVIFTSNSPLYGAKLIKNWQKLAKIAFFRHFWSKFGIYFAFKQAKMNKTCSIYQLSVKSITFYRYESIIRSKIIKKCQKLAKMTKNCIFGHFWRQIVKNYEFFQLYWLCRDLGSNYR